MQEYKTSDLSAFAWQGRNELIKILQSWNDHGLPEQFTIGEVIPYFEYNNGNVSLINEFDQECRLTDTGKLEMWETCRWCGHSGFDPDCVPGFNGGEGCNECEGNE